ncbi:type I polyketide synthase [Nocardiopsis suaedae]|uniref:Type I polyketide synthase n=1 Tax=Nocardiopsis suaedae TaxID=3018444 RepID=A0ABT4TL05_9ACTN|nr:type I polyketide synthase [Nocardiopsis suaedae]MDA2804777.1 type I polyketide synthase [Nocardiopsis suaedae]
MTDRPASEVPEAPIAITGIGCNLPGGATGPEEFWEMLCAGVDATRDLPEDRWDVRKFSHPDGDRLGKSGPVHGGFLERVDRFDAQFFGVSPREAAWMDPQQRLLLQAAWEALEDGGRSGTDLAGGDTGVFTGGFTLDYQLLQNYGIYSRYQLEAHSATGMMMTMLANRLSYAFDLRGPSLAVDTACSGSLVAVHLAVQSLRRGECSTALAGGVNVMAAPTMTIAESKGGFLSPEGRCRSFDAAAAGYARGEGAAMVLLKPLDRALEDRDPVYAVIRGTAVSQDGHTGGITVPNGDAQQAAMRTACRRAGIAPREIDYVEAHGTGTPVGDPVEAHAIGRALAADRPPGAEPLLIGSVKTNIGHLEAAAGVAGLIKAALSLKHRRIPGQLHFNEPNPDIPFEELGLRVQTRPGEWPAKDGPRCAGVNSFGFGGTNAHAVLQEAPAEEPAPAQGADGEGRRYLVPLSARGPGALTDMARSLGDALTGHGHALRDVGYTRSRRRAHFEHRAAVVASTPAEAAERLAALARGEPGPGAVTGQAPSGEPPRTAFVCSGMGPQWWAMGRRLIETEPVFRAAVERCDAELRTFTDRSLMAELCADEGSSRMAETEVAQPANFALQVGLAELWRSWGVVPEAVLGHSTGEVAAQYLAGVLGFEDAVKVTYHRSSLQQRATGAGRMLAVGMTPETLDKAVADAGPRVSVAAVNSPGAATLSGDAEVLEGMAAQLETFGVFHRFLPVKVPYHSHAMDVLRPDLLRALAGLRPRSAALPLYSTVTGCRIDGGGADAHYWWQNVRATVLFAAAFRQLLADGYTRIVELSPHPVLAGAMRELIAEHGGDGAVVPSLRRDRPDDAVMLESLGRLYTLGHDVAWDRFYGEDARFVRLPTYPWQLQSHWNEPAEAAEDRHYDEVHPLIGQRLAAARPAWEREIGTGALPYLADHRVQGTALLPGAAMVEMAAAAARDAFGEADYSVEALDLRKALVLGDACDPRVRTTLHEDTAAVEIAGYSADREADRRWTVHASARLSRRRPERTRRDLERARGACRRHLDHEEVYRRTAAMGLEYGPSFRAVQEVATGPDIAVGRIAVPEALRADLDRYRFHPCLTDAAFQVLLAAAAPADADGGAAPYLPVGIDRVSVLAPPADEMYAVAEVTSTDEHTIVSDIALCDADGRVLLDVQGFRARSLESVSGLSPERIDAGLYELQWQRAPVDEGADGPVGEAADQSTDHSAGPVVDGGAEAAAGAAGEGPWLVFADRTGVADRLRKRLAATGRRCLLVYHGDVPEPVPDGEEVLTIDPASPEHHHRTVRRLAVPATGDAPATVVHLWSLDAPDEAALNDGAPDEAALNGRAPDGVLRDGEDTGALSVLHLMQALSGEHAPASRVWLVTRRAQPVGGAPVAVEQAPVWGLGRVIGHQEFAGRWGGLVDLDDGDPDDQAQRLIEEITGGRGEDQVAFREGRRHVARLVPAGNLTRPFPLTLRPDGAYLVTGGLGALGLLVARLLADRGARNLVLMGRTPVPPRGEWAGMGPDHPRRHLVDALLDLERRGATVHCAAVDVADGPRLRAWSREWERDLRPPIRGVVHTAGVVRDELLTRMDREAFQRVLRPKVAGGRNLHRLFRDAPLDLFVLFGSTGSVIASPGQGNYAAGNAYLDALAHHRRSLGLPALTIGWGPWSVGMADAPGLAQMYERKGIGLITPENGMRILERVLDQAPAHLVAVTVDWPTARRAAHDRLPPMFAQVGAEEDAEAAPDDGASVLDALRRSPAAGRPAVLAARLRGITAAVLRLDPAGFGDGEPLSGLGVDSMMAVEMKHRIDAELGIDVPVLDLLEGTSIAGLADRTLAMLRLGDAGGGEPGPSPERPPDAAGAEPAAQGAAAHDPAADELEALLAQLPPESLEQILDELDSAPDSDPHSAPDGAEPSGAPRDESVS